VEIVEGRAGRGLKKSGFGLSWAFNFELGISIRAFFNGTRFGLF